ncbi:hypothetical protein FJZ33_11980 [Candidatus Poribacteria bacterium]|nr:hypothetical protein [Candidatus Poribacteria bacterium]
MTFGHDVSVASEQKVGVGLCKKSYNANKDQHLQRKASDIFFDVVDGKRRPNIHPNSCKI